MRDLTVREVQAIGALKRAAKIWPKTLWLFSGSGTLHVMMKDEDGKRIEHPSGGMEQAASVAHIEIENDGGDW